MKQFTPGVPNLFSLEGSTGHGIKCHGPQHGGFPRIMKFKMKLMLCLVQMSAQGVARGPEVGHPD